MLTRREVLIGAAVSAAGVQPAWADGGPAPLSSRIVTTMMLDDDPPAVRVSWMYWDSPYRQAGLRIGDRIVAIGGQPVVRPTATADLQRISSTTIGQYDEARGFAALSLSEAAPLALTLRRRRPVQGWDVLTVTAPLIALRPITDAQGNRLLGRGGPSEMASDGFSESWGEWDERVVREYTLILDGGWQRATFSSRAELRLHQQRRPQVDYLRQHYPGRYAAAAQADWDAVQACLQGAAVTLPPGALDYRQAEDERVQQVRTAAQTAWQAAQDGVASAAIPAFPAVHPIHGDYLAVVGKPVVLPPLGNQDWLAESGHGWFVAGNASDNWYFIDAEGAKSIAMLRARERFERLVSPSLQPSYAFIGRITPQPKLMVIDDSARFGLQLDLAAALVGDAMFVDLTQPGADAPFAGEAAFHQPPGALPPADAGPAEVMAALIAALKNNDQGLWNELFADWQTEVLDNGMVTLLPGMVRVTDEDWSRARASILGRVFDARVNWTGDARLLLDGTAYPGAPRVEAVDVEIDHIGSFEEGYRVFTDSTVNRRWELQRVNGGPWRIHSVQSI